MSAWLETPRDDVERALKEALSAARQRGADEIARRRVWSRVSEADAVAFVGDVGGRRAGRALGRWLVAGTLALGASGAAAAVVLMPSLGSRPSPSSTTSAASVVVRPVVAEQEQEPEIVRPVLPVAPIPVAPTRASDEPRLVLGAGIHRTRPRERLRGVMRTGARIDVEGNSEVLLADRRAAVRNGAVSFDVPAHASGRAFVVTAATYRMVVLGTKFRVRVDHSNLGIDVDEGTVEIWRGARRLRRIPAGDRWSTHVAVARVDEAKPAVVVEGVPAEAPAVAPAPPPPVQAPAPEIDPFREVHAALSARETGKAVGMLREIARGAGPAAEIASYEIGRVYFHRMRRPADALSAWRGYRTRFPNGILRAEADISILDALVAGGDNEGAVVEAEAFLSRHRDNERRSDVAATLARLRRLVVQKAAPPVAAD